MFLSFPEYFEIHDIWLEQYKHLFRWLMFTFSLPVVFYAASDYFRAAYRGLRSKMLNIDIPIALGIAVLFIRSTVEITMDWGTGFFDSLTGLVFFLLVGKFFQQKTYSFLSFERDYKSYFPIAVTRISGAIEEQVPVYRLKKGETILIRHGELLPVDGELKKGTAMMDYSFVSGESVPVYKTIGERLFAGGRQQGGGIEVEVKRSVAQSYLTQLWNKDAFKKEDQEEFNSITHLVSRYFTPSILAIALVSGLIWSFHDFGLAINVFTAVLIVACPCAIALAAPFTLGNVMRIFGQLKMYVKGTHVIENMAKINLAIFDKTGTLTSAEKNIISYEGINLSEEEQDLLRSTVRVSNHPLSRALYETLQKNNIVTLDEYEELPGEGIRGQHGSHVLKVGALDYVRNLSPKKRVDKPVQTAVHIGTETGYKGYYCFQNSYRPQFEQLFQRLAPNIKCVILSGDNSGEYEHLKGRLPEEVEMHFNQSPEDKMEFISSQNNEGYQSADGR